MKSLDEALAEHELRMQNSATAFQVYNQLLSNAERAALRSLEVEYTEGATVGLWMRAKGVSWRLAIVQLAIEFGLPASDANWMLRELDEPEIRSNDVRHRPVWDRDRRELRLNGEIIRSLRASATNCIALLNAFQECGWPTRIDDPIPGGRNAQRLGNTVRQLNEGLSGIEFRRDGTGQGVYWEPDVDPAS